MAAHIAGDRCEQAIVTGADPLVQTVCKSHIGHNVTCSVFPGNASKTALCEVKDFCRDAIVNGKVQNVCASHKRVCEPALHEEGVPVCASILDAFRVLFG